MNRSCQRRLCHVPCGKPMAYRKKASYYEAMPPRATTRTHRMAEAKPQKNFNVSVSHRLTARNAAEPPVPRHLINANLQPAFRITRLRASTRNNPAARFSRLPDIAGSLCARLRQACEAARVPPRPRSQSFPAPL